MLAVAFPWDVAITAISTLVAGLGAALWTARRTINAESRRWQLDRTADATIELLGAWTVYFAALGRVPSKLGVEPSSAERWAPIPEAEPWNAALDRIAVVGNEDLVRAAQHLDTEMWRLSLRVKHLAKVADHHWVDHTRNVHAARLALVNTARRALGSTGTLSETWGRPPRDDEIWSDRYWDEERKIALQSIAEAGGYRASSEPQ